MTADRTPQPSAAAMTDAELEDVTAGAAAAKTAARETEARASHVGGKVHMEDITIG